MWYAYILIATIWILSWRNYVVRDTFIELHLVFFDICRIKHLSPIYYLKAPRFFVYSTLNLAENMCETAPP